jgi:hypothetical protein
MNRVLEAAKASDRVAAGTTAPKSPVRLFGRLVTWRPIPDAAGRAAGELARRLAPAERVSTATVSLDLGLRSKRTSPMSKGELIESKSGDKRILGRDTYGVHA